MKPIPEGLYNFANSLLDDLEIMPSREQQAEHLSKSLKLLVDEIVRMITDDIKDMLANDLR